MKPIPKTLIFTAIFTLFSPTIFAQYPTKTTGCPNEWGMINSPLNPPQFHTGYAYYCIAPDPTQNNNCALIKAGPIQAKFPLSTAYQNSPQFAKYLQKLANICTSADPNSGIQARFYMIPKNTKNPVIPQKCDLINGKEVCAKICKTPPGDCS